MKGIFRNDDCGTFFWMSRGAWQVHAGGAQATAFADALCRLLRVLYRTLLRLMACCISLNGKMQPLLNSYKQLCNVAPLQVSIFCSAFSAMIPATLPAMAVAMVAGSCPAAGIASASNHKRARILRCQESSQRKACVHKACCRQLKCGAPQGGAESDGEEPHLRPN